MPALYRSHLTFLPMSTFGKVGKCTVRDAIAKTMGGVSVPLEETEGKKKISLWHFPTASASCDFVLLSILATCGSLKTHKAICRQVVWAIASKSGKCKEEYRFDSKARDSVSAVAVKRKGADKAFFYMLTSPNKTDEVFPYLAIAFPQSNVKRDNSKGPLIVRLL